MMPSHLVARCVWQSEFDEQEKAVALQDYLSRWSKTVLLSLVSEFFDRICLTGETWQIQCLTLNLGEIPFQDISDELPKRFNMALQEAIGQLFSRQQHLIAVQQAPNLQILDHATEQQNIMRCFLLNGTAPWWSSGQIIFTDVFDEQVRLAPQACTSLIRRFGKIEAVRRRLVWQLGEKRVKKIIRLLEPQHADFIDAYADNLRLMQEQKQQFPSQNQQEFRQQIWLNILTYLLVDRGTLFNTIAFVRATLHGFADHYQLDYHLLLAQLAKAVTDLYHIGMAAPNCLAALVTIQREEQVIVPSAPARRPPPNYWASLEKLLRQGQKRCCLAGEIVELEELVTALSGQDGLRMARALRKNGQADKVRQLIITHFSDSGLALVIQVLAPQHHLLIMAHAAQTQIALRREKINEEMIWQVLLAYLLVDRGSFFNRRQFIRESLLEICRRQRLSYLFFLDILLQQSVIHNPTNQQFELLSILQELRRDSQKKLQQQQCLSFYQQALNDYLSGKSRRCLSAQQLPPLGQIAILLAKTKHPQYPSILAAVVATIRRQQANDLILGRRLLQLYPSQHFAELVTALSAAIPAFCLCLHEQVQAWLQQMRLPALQSIDFSRDNNLWFLLAFWQTPERLTAECFCQAWLKVLQQQHPSCFSQLISQLRVCYDALPAKAQAGLHALSLHLPTDAEKLHLPLSVSALHAAPQTLDEYFTQLHHLLLKPSLTVTELQNLAHIWQQLIQDQPANILPWLNRQEEQSRLLEALVRYRDIATINTWLNRLLPDEISQPDKIIAQWQEVLLRSGLWQGATARLQWHLSKIFWQVGLIEWSGAATMSLVRRPADQLLARMAIRACQELDVRVSDCLDSFAAKLPSLTDSSWQKASLLMHRQFKENSLCTEKKTTATVPFQQDVLCDYLTHPALADVLIHLLRYGRLPANWPTHTPVSLARLLADLCTYYPQRLPQLLAGLQNHPGVLTRLQQHLSMQQIIESIRRTEPHYQATITQMEQFTRWLDCIALPGISAAQRQALLQRLFLQHWLAGDWEALLPETLLRQFCYKFCQQYDFKHGQFINALQQVQDQLPVAWQRAVDALLPSSQTVPKEQENRDEVVVQIEQTDMNNQPSSIPMSINNAGLVLLNSYFNLLFSRLNFLTEGVFSSEEQQRQGVHYLQFLVSGAVATPEQYLMLNKVLCGLPLTAAVEAGINLSPTEKELCEGLLSAMISYWSAIGTSSLDGFRGNWLVRDATLSEKADNWDLIVEKRPYDLLLQRSPFSYSIIKLPWMSKPLYVTWPT